MDLGRDMSTGDAVRGAVDDVENADADDARVVTR